MSDYLDVPALAAVLHCAPQTILNRRSRAPWRLPPDCTPANTTRLIWRRADVDGWLASQVKPAAVPPRLPGRPRKTGKDVRHG